MTHIAIQEHLDGKTADWMDNRSFGTVLLLAAIEKRL